MTAAASPRESSSGGLGFLLPLLGVLVGGSMLAWVSGGVAGWLFGAGWPHAAVGGVLAGWVRHRTDPRMGWPDPSGLPDAGHMYGVLAGVLVLLVLLAVAGLFAYRRVKVRFGRTAGAVTVPGSVRRGMRKAGAHRTVDHPNPDSGGFATRRDVSTVIQEGPGRIPLGWAYGRMVRTHPEHSLLVVGPARSGKTSAYAIPAVLGWDGPAVVCSSKTDVVLATAQARRSRGRVFVFDPSGVSGQPQAGWSPLQHCQDWRGAVETADLLTSVGGVDGAGDTNFWKNTAAGVLAPLLLCAANTPGMHMGHVYHWLRTMDLTEVVGVRSRDGGWSGGALRKVAATGLAGAQDALEMAEAQQDRERRAKDGSFSTAASCLHVYGDDRVVQASMRHDIDPAGLVAGHDTLYLVGSGHHQRRLASLFVTLLRMVTEEAFARSARLRITGEQVPDDCRLLLMLDEAAHIAPLKDLGALAAQAGGEGMTLVTVVQSMAQLEARYGSHEWGDIAANHLAKVNLPGSTDPTTLRFFRDVIGGERVDRTSHTRGDGRESTTTSSQEQPLLEQSALRELADGTGIVVYGNLPPIWVRQYPWYADRTMRAMVEQQPDPPIPDSPDEPVDCRPTQAPAGPALADVLATVGVVSPDPVPEAVAAVEPPAEPAVCAGCGCPDVGGHRGVKGRGACLIHAGCLRFRRDRARPLPLVVPPSGVEEALSAYMAARTPAPPAPTVDVVAEVLMAAERQAGAAIPVCDGVVRFDGRFFRSRDDEWVEVTVARRVAVLEEVWGQVRADLQTKAAAVPLLGREPLGRLPGSPFRVDGLWFVPNGSGDLPRLEVGRRQVAALNAGLARWAEATEGEGN